ncbi:hypothetical protein XBKB1_3370002 [Xenorhabdus bovienii str. kraussei Becker Underwood]|uniref:Uncharacterized protein n=1 Tax=Xenorhabdus bovienii str. kraussei Becker Underwood TaxID=1398204 RepID=A0A077PKL7_XENBV|nr:hypothetical protein XBKB1_3370002 [Xenorhabdus bovienii str. kraussei Becker Underwood]
MLRVAIRGSYSHFKVSETKGEKHLCVILIANYQIPLRPYQNSSLLLI